MGAMNSYVDKSDLELITLMKQHDQAAFTEIYQRYWKKLFTVATNKIQDLEEAREIVQNVFISLWNRREQLEINSSLQNYLAVSVKYRVINLLARLNTKRFYLDSLDQAEIDDSTQQWLDFMELKEQLSKLVNDLPEKCRIVFIMSREEGHSHKEISKKLGISEKTIEGHLTKAIKLLKDQLNNYFLTLL